MIQSYQDLTVWKRAMELSLECYELARCLPTFETYGLASQLRRGAVSVSANIAEGHGRIHRGDYIHQLSVARGSLTEVETLLLLAQRIHHSKVDRAMALAAEVGRMLNRLIASLRRSSDP